MMGKQQFPGKYVSECVCVVHLSFVFIINQLAAVVGVDSTIPNIGAKEKRRKKKNIISIKKRLQIFRKLLLLFQTAKEFLSFEKKYFLSILSNNLASSKPGA